jgi:serine/threonine-protein kinase
MPAVSIALPDRYRATRRIAGGGMATVYECEDQLLGRVVAVKVLAPHFASDVAARARFQREARAAARVSDHPHVATIYDIGEEEGLAFITMEYFSGGTVGDRLRSGRPIPRDTALQWLEQAASALDHAHKAGIVHRDVKPANLLLDAGGRLAVADFGIARLATETGVTSTGTVMGTAAYLSPEQALGEPATAASDRYALAVVAYELLTGARPFNAEHAAAQARAHVEAEPPRAGLGTQADRALARGLEKDPAARWPTASAMVEALDGEAAPARPQRTAPTQPVTAAHPSRPRWAPIVLAALIIGLLAGGAIAALTSGGDDREQSASTPQRTERSETAERESTRPEQEQPAAQEQPPAQTATQEDAPSTPTGDASELNDQGYALMQKGDYAGAIPVLEQAVQDCPISQTDPCAYAMFNLGRSLIQAGRPADAIPVLEQRLQNPNQNGIVRKELKAAQRAAGQG